MSSPVLNRFVEKFLGNACLYETCQRLFGAPAARRVLVTQYLRPRPGESILEVGCGPAHLISELPESCSYVGYDPCSPYIEEARKKHGERGLFYCCGVGEENDAILQRAYDLVFAVGVLHHLSDDLGRTFFNTAAALLSARGRIVTLDPVLFDGQSRISQWFALKDRGKYVRDSSSYRALIPEGLFDEIEIASRSDLLRIPYCHCIIQCRKERADILESLNGRD